MKTQRWRQTFNEHGQSLLSTVEQQIRWWQMFNEHGLPVWHRMGCHNLEPAHERGPKII
jgi:hypothetical protein